MKLLIEEPPLQVLPTLAVRIGLNEAIVLQQLHYLTLRSKGAPIDKRLERREGDDEREKAWADEFKFWSVPTIKRTFKSLRDQGLVVAEQPHGSDRSNRYRVDYDALEALDQSDPLEEINLIPSNGSRRSAPTDQPDPVEEITSTPSFVEVTTEVTATTEPSACPSSSPDGEDEDAEGRRGANGDVLDTFGAENDQHALRDQRRATARRVMLILNDVAEHRRVEAPTIESIEAVLEQLPNRDHLAVADELEWWAIHGAGRQAAIRDMPSLYREFVSNAPAVANARLAA